MSSVMELQVINTIYFALKTSLSLIKAAFDKRN